MALSSQAEYDVIEIALDYYFGAWQDLVRDFKMQGYTDVREMLHYSMERFIIECQKAGPHFVNAQNRKHLKLVHAEIKSHYLELWKFFENDPEYQNEIGERGYLHVKNLRLHYSKPPLTTRDLSVLLASAEAYMLVIGV